MVSYTEVFEPSWVFPCLCVFSPFTVNFILLTLQLTNDLCAVELMLTVFVLQESFKLHLYCTMKLLSVCSIESRVTNIPDEDKQKTK